MWNQIGLDIFEEKICYTNSNNSKNVRQMDDSLVMTAIKEKYLNRDFTSGWIQTKNYFSYGKLEIKAAMPRGTDLFALFISDPKIMDKIIRSINMTIHRQLK